MNGPLTAVKSEMLTVMDHISAVSKGLAVSLWLAVNVVNAQIWAVVRVWWVTCEGLLSWGTDSCCLLLKHLDGQQRICLRWTSRWCHCNILGKSLEGTWFNPEEQSFGNCLQGCREIFPQQGRRNEQAGIKLETTCDWTLEPWENILFKLKFTPTSSCSGEVEWFIIDQRVLMFYRSKTLTV